MTYVAADATALPLGEGTAQAAGMAGEPAGAGDGIAWRPALKTALMLAVPTAVLCLGLLPVGLFGVLGAGAWTVSIYSRRARTGPISAMAGARIGLVTGLLAGWLTFSLYGLQFWSDRFLLHQGSDWDSLWQARVEKSFQNQQMVAQMGTTTVQAAQLSQSIHDLMLSSEGRAAGMVSGLLFLAVLLVFFATVGGAVGARFLAQPRGPSA